MPQYNFIKEFNVLSFRLKYTASLAYRNFLMYFANKNNYITFP